MIKAFFILATVASIQATEMRSKTDDCSLVTFNKCIIDGVVSEYPATSAEACQQYCELFPGQCRTFIYDGESCTLISRIIQEHVSNCLQVAGPAAPPIGDCLATTEPCKYFHEESCEYGSEVRHFIGIPSPAFCQKACSLESSCAYFLHDLGTFDCYLYNSTQRTCSTIAGPMAPRLEECFPTTTVPPSTTPPPVPELCTTKVYKKSNGSCACGRFLDKKYSWHDGVAQCSALNARLPEILSWEENRDLAQIIVEAEIWLGANDFASNDRYVWNSGLPATYLNWARWEPNNYGVNQQCLRFYIGGLWDDYDCFVRQQIFCEFIFECQTEDPMRDSV